MVVELIMLQHDQLAPFDRPMFAKPPIANRVHDLRPPPSTQTKYFRISITRDEVGSELCGALKNIVAVGAGVTDGLGYGDNTKAAVIRLGFMEMRSFIFQFFGERGTFLCVALK